MIFLNKKKHKRSHKAPLKSYQANVSAAKKKAMRPVSSSGQLGKVRSKQAGQASAKLSYKQAAPLIARQRKLRFGLKKWIFTSGIVILLLLITGGTWLWASGASERFIEQSKQHFYAWTASHGIILHDIFLEGQHHADVDQILKQANLDIGMPLYAVDLDNVKARIEQLPWIKQAAVSRDIPSSLTIRIIEREPVALWQYQGKVQLIDGFGNVIEEANVSDFKQLPILVGEDAHINCPYLMSVLNQDQKLLKHISSATRVGGRRWDISTFEGVTIKLPEQDMEAAYNLLKSLQNDQGLFDSDIKVIDLRLKDTLSIQRDKNKKEKSDAGAVSS